MYWSNRWIRIEVLHGFIDKDEDKDDLLMICLKADKKQLLHLNDLGAKTVKTFPCCGGRTVILSFSRRCWQSGITATHRCTRSGSSSDQG